MLALCCALTAAPAQWEQLAQTLFIAPTANPQTRTAAEALASAIEHRVGVRPQLRAAPFLGKPRGIYVGHSLLKGVFDDDPLTDEVAIAVTPHGLVITGSDNTATQIAMARFQQQFLGLRRYFPGTLGSEWLDTLPPLPELTTERLLLSERSPFVARNLSGLGGRAFLGDWPTFQGLRERFSYNHVHYRQIRPAHFADYPEWFAKDSDGAPLPLPFKRPHGYNHHPDFSSEATLQRLESVAWHALCAHTGLPASATAHVAPLLEGDTPRDLAAVRQSPGSVSISLGANDSYVFGAFSEDFPYPADGYFRRWPDYSNTVFSAANTLAERLGNHWQTVHARSQNPPQLYFGTLAYLLWEDRPDFPLHPQIIPYMTYDRTQWFDPAAKADDLANLANWAAAESRINATWDYIFGVGFLIPRSLTQIVAESIPALAENRVSAYFSQVGAIWPYDAHTTWLTTRLLWNPSADAEALLSEFFDEVYGVAAAPMRRFFLRAETTWMQQHGSGWWLRWWIDTWQTSLYDGATLAAMRSDLDAATAAAATAAPRFQQRVAMVADAFALTEALHAWMQAQWNLAEFDSFAAVTPARSAKFNTLLQGVLDGRRAFAAQLEKVSAAGPLLAQLNNNMHNWLYRDDAAVGSAVANLRNILRFFPATEPAVQSAITQLNALWQESIPTLASPEIATDSEGNPRQINAGVLASLRRQLLSDPQFAQLDNPVHWRSQFIDSEDLSVAQAADNRFLEVKNGRRGFVVSGFPVQAGQPYLARLIGSTDIDNSAQVGLRIDFFDAQGTPIGSSPRARITPSFPPVNPGQPRDFTLHTFAFAPANAAQARIYIRFYEMNAGTTATLYNAAVYGR